DAPIIISESTWVLVDGQFPARALGEVTVKGKAVPVRIHAVLLSSTRTDERVPADMRVAITAGQVTVEAAVHDLTVGGLSVRELPLALTPGVFASGRDRKSTRLNSSHVKTSYAVFCLKKKK